ncbi:MAG: hypothetical protein ACE5QV_09020 [Fidelibacterota bacterium]
MFGHRRTRKFQYPRRTRNSERRIRFRTYMGSSRRMGKSVIWLIILLAIVILIIHYLGTYIE